MAYKSHHLKTATFAGADIPSIISVDGPTYRGTVQELNSAGSTNVQIIHVYDRAVDCTVTTTDTSIASVSGGSFETGSTGALVVTGEQIGDGLTASTTVTYTMSSAVLADVAHSLTYNGQGTVVLKFVAKSLSVS